MRTLSSLLHALTRHRIVKLRGPAPARRHVDDLREHFRIETQSLAEQHCLRRADHSVIVEVLLIKVVDILFAHSIARSMLLQIFAAWPVPGAPVCTTFLPMRAKTGWARAKPSGEPPTMNVRPAFCAATTPTKQQCLAPLYFNQCAPPDTGASR